LEHHTYYGKYCSLKLEAWAVGVTAGSGEVPGRKGLWQETKIIIIIIIIIIACVCNTGLFCEGRICPKSQMKRPSIRPPLWVRFMYDLLRSHFLKLKEPLWMMALRINRIVNVWEADDRMKIAPDAATY
jgi:hypothetical protein